MSDEEQNLLGNLMAGERGFAAGQDVVASGSRPAYRTLILDGATVGEKHFGRNLAIAPPLAPSVQQEIRQWIGTVSKAIGSR